MSLSDKPRRVERLVYIFSWIAGGLLFLWLSWPAPKFHGVAGAICVAYFLALACVSICSFIWLFRFDRSDNPARKRNYMIASLVISILSFVASALFALFAIAVSGLLGFM